ncbi:chorismate mutase [Nesterenkonia aurantiaca]|uniref:chorismate mutase n=1 Tax=Nesterenkonia aurantiaca TaxID=1436010 RepID=UPI003EE6E130
MSTDPRAGEAGTQIEPEILDELLSMRASIDNIDATLVYLLAERFKATQRVGVLKAKHQLPAADPAREKNQISRLKRLANEAQLDPEFAEKFLNFIIEEVIRHHQAISSAGLGSEQSSTEALGAAAVGPGESAADAAAPHDSTDR